MTVMIIRVMGTTVMATTIITITPRASGTRSGGFPATRIMVTTMGDPAGQAALLRLMTWLSPAFPVGAFAYSHGLERAIHDGVIADRENLVAWISDLVQRGSGWNDAVLLAEAWRNAGGDPVAELAEALAGSRERHMETTLQGEAFLNAIESWAVSRSTFASATSASPDAELQVRPSQDSARASYPVAVGQIAAINRIDLESTLAAYLHAFTSNLIQASMRLVPLGQRDGVAAIAALEPVILETARRAALSTLDDLGSATFMSEISAMRHEVQYSRVFRS